MDGKKKKKKKFYLAHFGFGMPIVIPWVYMEMVLVSHDLFLVSWRTSLL